MFEDLLVDLWETIEEMQQRINEAGNDLVRELLTEQRDRLTRIRLYLQEVEERTVT